MMLRRFWGSILGGADRADSRLSFVVSRLELKFGGDLATIDVLFGARHIQFANDLSAARLPESKHDAFLHGVSHMLSGRSGVLGIGLMLEPTLRRARAVQWMQSDGASL